MNRAYQPSPPIPSCLGRSIACKNPRAEERRTGQSGDDIASCVAVYAKNDDKDLFGNMTKEDTPTDMFLFFFYYNIGASLDHGYVRVGDLEWSAMI